MNTLLFPFSPCGLFTCKFESYRWRCLLFDFMLRDLRSGGVQSFFFYELLLKEAGLAPSFGSKA